MTAPPKLRREMLRRLEKAQMICSDVLDVLAYEAGSGTARDVERLLTAGIRLLDGSPAKVPGAYIRPKRVEELAGIRISVAFAVMYLGRGQQARGSAVRESTAKGCIREFESARLLLRRRP